MSIQIKKLVFIFYDQIYELQFSCLQTVETSEASHEFP